MATPNPGLPCVAVVFERDHRRTGIREIDMPVTEGSEDLELPLGLRQSGVRGSTTPVMSRTVRTGEVIALGPTAATTLTGVHVHMKAAECDIDPAGTRSRRTQPAADLPSRQPGTLGAFGSNDRR